MNAAPYWNILPKAQATLWARLGALPKHFVLYGGTAQAVEEIQNVPAVEVEPLGRIGEVAPAAL